MISSQWVDVSTQPYIDEAMPSVTEPTLLNYGYQWWLFQDDAEEVSDLMVNDMYFSWGYAGQFIFVVPHLDLVVVSTGGNYEDSDRFFAALKNYIFPAIQQLSVPEPTSISLMLLALAAMFCGRKRFHSV